MNDFFDYYSLEILTSCPISYVSIGIYHARKYSGYFSDERQTTLGPSVFYSRSFEVGLLGSIDWLFKQTFGNLYSLGNYKIFFH